MTLLSNTHQHPEWIQYDASTKKTLILLNLLEKKNPSNQTILDEVRRLWSQSQRQKLQVLFHDESIWLPLQPIVHKNGQRVFHGNTVVQWLVQQTPYHRAPFLPGFSLQEQSQLGQLLGLSEMVFLSLPFCDKRLKNRVLDQVTSVTPMHPVAITTVNASGQYAFKENALLTFLVQSCPIWQDRPIFSDEDEIQLKQLLGQSIGMAS